MRSTLLLGLLGASLTVHASVSKHAFRLKEAPEYTKASEVAANSALKLLKRGDYVETASELVKSIAPNATFRVVGAHYVGTNGVGHVNFKQTAHGLDIENADFNVHIARDGSVFSFSNSFYAGEMSAEAPVFKQGLLDPINAFDVVVDTLSLPISKVSGVEATQESETYKITGTSGAELDPEANMVYFVKQDGSLALTWKVETKLKDQWLASYVDAEAESDVLGVIDYISFATYEVYPWGLNDPWEGERKVIKDPWDPVASRNGWHDKENSTLGNNVQAGAVPSNSGLVHMPQSDTLTFEYPFTPDTEPPTKKNSQNAALTQIFYTTNKYHDLLYTLGFTEVSGNMQKDNFGLGGRGSDDVYVRIQYWSGKNNGMFSQTRDGGRPLMTMFLFDYTDPERDVAFDNGFVIHEYTHGLSGRLTGGPANSNCLDAWEPDGMAEGWSDLYAAAVMLKPDDTRENATYGFAAWPLNKTDTMTARLVLYSTDMKINNWTYSKVNELTRVHQTGSVWATMLWEVMWNLIDKHGKNDADVPEFVGGMPTDGKYLTMKLLLDAMALQPCNPTFVQSRDAILDADLALTGGQNTCEIWKGFAKRGLGANAVFHDTNRVDNFDMPKDKAQDVTDDVIDKANEIFDEVGDKISDVREVIEQFIVKVLETVERELNEWIQEFANTLGNPDVAQRYLLHVTTFCHIPRSNFTANPTIKESNSTDAPLDKEDEFNVTKNDGRILGFPPGKITAEVLNLFMIPKEVQAKVRDPIDDTADYVQKILHDAKNTLKTWAIRLTFSPVLIFYAGACSCSWMLLLMLLADIGYSWFKKQVLPKTRLPYRVLPLLATFCLFMDILIVVVIGAVAKVIMRKGVYIDDVLKL
ncbi:hypothetical protein DL763_000066 [Monosporascus cannonballus]|nr:hypothetical protein DL763_000066 [Monosporascus cannonballus]